MPPIARRVADVSTTIFTEINNLASQHNAVNLGQGKPDFDGPDSMLQAAARSITEGKANQYPPGTGIPELRQGIAQHARHFYDLDIDPKAGVVVTVGAAEGVYATVQALVNPGDEVILIEPYFDTYLPAVEHAGGVPVYVPLRPPDWRFDPEELRAAFNDSTRAIVINTPHNPTGRVFSREELALIASLCQQYDALVIADEVYEHLTYDGAQHTPIATLPGMFERTVTVSSAAKTFSATGWKVGWAMGPPDLVTGVWRIRQNITFAVNHPGQYGVAHALTLGDDYYTALIDGYTKRRAILMDALQEAGLKVAAPPEGAFYIMADFSDVFDGDDRDFARYLIQEIGVACIPPSAFFSAPHRHLAHRHVRFSYCKNEAILHEAANRIAALKVQARGT